MALALARVNPRFTPGAPLVSNDLTPSYRRRVIKSHPKIGFFR